MKVDNAFFLHGLSDFINGKQTTTTNEIDWNAVLDLSQSHQVDGILYYQCGKLMPKSVCDKYEKNYYSSIHYFKKLENSIEKVSEAFRTYNIPFFIVKGMEIAKYYPIPSLRTMGDVDVVVAINDVDKAKNRLLELGFEYIGENPGKEIIFADHNVMYELHHKLIYDESITKEKHAVFFNDCWKYQKDDHIDINFHFLFLIAHLRKHLMNEGVGIRQFMDLALVAKNGKELDWELLRTKLEELELIQFAGVCMGLILKWFDIYTPISSMSLDENFTNIATEYILSNGVFGDSNPVNKNSLIINDINAQNSPRILAYLSVIIRRAFPKYDYLQTGKEYSFLKGKPWRLPFAWIYRFYLVLIGKKSSKDIIIDQLFISKNDFKSKEEMFRQWNLIQ